VAFETAWTDPETAWTDLETAAVAFETAVPETDAPFQSELFP
jgi:hypothetical protein